MCASSRFTQRRQWLWLGPKAALTRPDDHSTAAVHAEFVIDRRYVITHGLPGDTQLPGNVIVGKPLRQQTENLARSSR